MSEELRVFLYSGVYLHHDAVSNILHEKWQLLDDLRRGGLPVRPTIVCQGTNRDNPDVAVVSSPTEAMRLPGFYDAPLHVFDFAIYYELFNLVYALPKNVAVLGHYHNLTPAHLVRSEEVRQALEKAVVQRDNFGFCDHILCDSEFNRQDLLDLGYPAEQLEVITPPSRVQVHLARVPRQTDTPFTFLHVGRFTRGKGILVLLDAITRLRQLVDQPVRLVLAGNADFAEPEVTGRARAAQARGEVELVLKPDDDQLGRLYRQADVFVNASYHEGFCIPVLEAFASGCQAVTSDAGNLPFLVGDHGVLVPAGDSEALAEAMAQTVRVPAGHVLSGRGQEDRQQWADRLEQYLGEFSREVVHARYLASFGRQLERKGQRPLWWPAEVPTVPGLTEETAARLTG